MRHVFAHMKRSSEESVDSFVKNKNKRVSEMLKRIDLQNVTKVSKYRSACIFTVTRIGFCNYEKVLVSFETSVTTYQSTWSTSKKN